MRTNVKTKLKTYVVAMAMLFMPLAISAQTDGFFSSNNGGGSRGNHNIIVNNSDSNFETQTFGADPNPNSVSLGGGLLIMAAAGAGYLFLKKKEEK